VLSWRAGGEIIFRDALAQAAVTGLPDFGDHLSTQVARCEARQTLRIAFSTIDVNKNTLGKIATT
jgi:hypothetical protein